VSFTPIRGTFPTGVASAGLITSMVAPLSSVRQSPLMYAACLNRCSSCSFISISISTIRLSGGAAPAPDKMLRRGVIETKITRNRPMGDGAPAHVEAVAQVAIFSQRRPGPTRRQHQYIGQRRVGERL